MTLVPYNNKNLFSTHYLDKRLKESEEWNKEEKARTAYDQIKKIHSEKKDRIQTYTGNEAQLEEDFIRPVLRALSHVFGVQATIKKNAYRPDYGFFECKEDLDEAFKNKDSLGFYKGAIAVGDAKAWDKPLDKKLGGKDIFENRNPSYQIDYYLRTTQPKRGVLTNGRKWRLYFEESTQPIGTYYEVDLIDILERDDFADFKYFYFFFRREAFIPVGESFLDRVYDQSLRYAEEIGENLERSVYKALLWMAKGYFNMRTNKLEKNEENIRRVHENSLIFLYRLLFLFYAESKGMLGTKVPRRYANEYSFLKWIDDILNDIDNLKVNPKGGLYNHRLFSIFRLVREGSEELGISREEFYIPAYNGGLFDNEKHPFLVDKKIQDGHIARVVDLLARIPSKQDKDRSRIDYSDLSLRHLGGIYEGLLEFKPKLANQDRVAVKKKGALKWVSASEVKKDFSEFDQDKRVRKGELYLTTNKGERKATGSYYTPHYVVKYIVENSVGPVVEEKIEEAETIEEKRKAILDMKILDPAMGSGHFLVEATDFLANKLVKYIEEGEEEDRDIDWAKRKVARNCIYGVDVNPLATELAKVSLWLNTMAEDKPLSFLDHHLKTGNSLIGADIHKLDKHSRIVGKKHKKEEKSKQLVLSDFFGKSVRDDIMRLLGVYNEMLEVTEERPEDIKEQVDLFREFEAHPFKKKFDVLSDVYTGYYFGNEFSGNQYEKLLSAFRGGVEEWNEITREDWVRKASNSVPEKMESNLSDKKRFFHWKLEFPEVFFDIDKGEEKVYPGFDVVIGNPPYVSVGGLPQDSIDYLLSENYRTTQKRVDLYIAFIEKSLNLLRHGGVFSFIIPYPFLNQDYSELLRKKVLDENLIQIVDLSDYPVFGDAAVRSIVLIIQKGPQEGKMEVITQRENPNIIRRISGDKKKISPEDFANMFKHMFRLELGPDILKLKRKIDSSSFRLGYGLAGSWGARGSPISEFHFDEKVDEKCERLVKGRDLHSFYIDYKGRWLLYDYDKLYRPAFPELFENDKVMISKVTGPEGLIAAVDTDNYYTDDSICNCIKKTALIQKSDAFLNKRKIEVSQEQVEFISDYSLEYIASILNSSIMNFYFKTLVGYDLNVYPESVEYLPIKENPSKEISIRMKNLYLKISSKQGELYDETNSFLRWISREWKVDVENLSRKSYLKKYWKHGFDEDSKSILNIAKHNSSKVGVKPSSRNFQERLEKEWQASVDKLNPIVREISELETQIDALVFRLYELDEEEIKLVLDSLETEEEIKKDILTKFKEICV